MTDIENLEISIKALSAYSIEPNIIKDMLNKLSNINLQLTKVSRVELPVMVNFAEEIDNMLKNIEEYFDTPNYKNNVVEYKSYYDGAYNYLKQLKTILRTKSKISA